MNLKDIEKLMQAMGKANIRKVAIKQEGFEIELEMQSDSHETPLNLQWAQAMMPPHPFPMPLSTQQSGSHSGQIERASERAQDQRAESKPSEGQFILSPMVGTFYAASSPKDPSFIQVGDQVTEESVVCIIEAMKVMNEVKAHVRGRVVEILVKNGEPVEFGTKLMRVT